MVKEKTSKEMFKLCEKETKFLFQEEIDIRKIKAIKRLVENDLQSIKKIMQNISDFGWNIIYKTYYDCLLMLVEAFLRFEQIKSTNHQCVFAYLIEKHPELELDWNFFEKVRTKRNGSVYYGTQITLTDWNEVKVQLLLYVQTIEKALGEKIEEYELKNFDDE